MPFTEEHLFLLRHKVLDALEQLPHKIHAGGLELHHDPADCLRCEGERAVNDLWKASLPTGQILHGDAED